MVVGAGGRGCSLHGSQETERPGRGQGPCGFAFSGLLRLQHPVPQVRTQAATWELMEGV